MARLVRRTTASSCATCRCLHQRGFTSDGRHTLICSRQSCLVVQSCVSSCHRCVFTMNAFAFFASNFMSNHFLFTPRTDLLTGDTALTASVTSLRCTRPRHTAADKGNKMIFLTCTSPKITSLSASEKFFSLSLFYLSTGRQDAPLHSNRCFL